MAAIDTSVNLEWVRTGDGVYQRDLDSVETFYEFIAKVGIGRPDRANWSVSMGIQVRTAREDFVGDVREAWVALRYEMPTLAAFIQEGRWTYNTVDREGLGSWLQETFHVHAGVNKPARHFFPLEELVQSPRAVLHVFPQTQEVVVQGPHTHLDATGMILFFDQLLKHLVEPRRGTCIRTLAATGSASNANEAANLVPPLAITARIPEPTVEQIEIFNNSMKSFVLAQPGIKLHAENPTAPASASRLLWLAFDADETARIAARAKALGVTVTAVLQAAISHAAAIHGSKSGEQRGSGGQRKHAIMALYDARSYVDATAYPQSRLVAPHVFAMPAVYPVGLESPASSCSSSSKSCFAETARAARTEFLRFAQGDVVRATSPLWARQTIDLLSMPMPAGAPVPADLNFSSIGVVDRILQPVYRHEEGTGSPDEQLEGRSVIEVEDIWIGLDMLHPTCLVEAWTFRGRLRVELIYNSAYHGMDSMAYLCSLMHEHLCQGLGLDLKYNLKTQ